MLDAYIKIDEIKKLLDEAKSINGLIKRNDFQKAVTRLKEYRKPKIKYTNRIKNRQILITLIENHINDIINKKIIPEIYVSLENLTNLNFSNRKIELFETDFWDKDDIKGKIDISDIIESKREIMEVLGISNPTFIRFKRLGIFKEYRITIKLEVSGVVRLSDKTLYFYKWSDILRYLSN